MNTAHRLLRRAVVPALFAPLITLLFFTGCLSSAGPKAIGTGPVKVVATTSMIADAVRQVGGSNVEVTALMGPGTDPHTYSPQPGDSEALSSAHIVFFNGLHLEGKMSHLLEEGKGGTHAVAVTRDIPQSKIRHAEGGDSAHDPHVWFDVKLWMICIGTICEELKKLDPQRAEQYDANAKKYLATLAELDQEVRTKAAKIPEKQRVLVTSHDAFGYFAQAYGFEVRGLQGVSTAAAVGTNDIDELATFLGTRQIRAVFCETSVRPKGLEKVQSIVKEKYKRDIVLIGGEDALYSDALGEAGTPGETYVGTVRHNIDVISKALTP